MTLPQMYTINEQHHELYRQLAPEVAPQKRLVIGIDGRDGVGKSTLGRWMSWQLAASLIETDNFIVGNGGPGLEYRTGDLSKVISSRISSGSRGRPVILDGVCLLRLLEDLNLSADYMVYVESESQSPGSLTSESIAPYEDEYDPRSKANFIFNRSILDDQ